ncbi:MAG: helix-turn-helix domain-containing protein [Bdellovibrionales bacterium]
MLMTIEDLVSYLKISKETIYKMAQRGSIPATKIGNQWRFQKDQIDKWLSKNSNEVGYQLSNQKDPQ